MNRGIYALVILPNLCNFTFYLALSSRTAMLFGNMLQPILQLGGDGTRICGNGEKYEISYF